MVIKRPGTMHTITGCLPPLGVGEQTTVFAKSTALSKICVEPIGRWFEAFASRRRQHHSVSRHSIRSSTSEDSNSGSSGDDEENQAMLQSMDPRQWKDQDHYAVLGLGSLRYKATDYQIKRSYKKKVLRHHPDKRRARGISVIDNEDDYFTCITRANEVLGNPLKRRSYDSIDPEFDDTVPQISSESKEDFISVFASVFEQNKRWSNKQPVPGLGSSDATFDQVNSFYSFWYDFDSWREYSYLDEEEKEKGENRDERRWIDKKNKAARQTLKKEETTRMRQLVDNAYACDPRIQKFKDDEKERKLAVKRAKQDAARARLEEEERKKQEILEAERRKREIAEEVARQQAAVVKKEKDALKKILRKERKTLRTTVKEMDYFSKDDEARRVINMAEVEKLAELLSVTSLQTLNADLTSGDPEKARQGFHDQLQQLNARLEEEKRQLLAAAASQKSAAPVAGTKKGGAPWSDEEVQLLIKAVNLFPAGTNQRWEVIASFLSQHMAASSRTAKETLSKAKALQKMDPSMKQQANDKAFQKFEKEAKTTASSEESKPSQRYELVAEQQVSETGTNVAPWTSDEQRHLEQALKTFPANTPERWECIAGVIPTRSKKDCMKRYKELVELIRAKKAAASAAAAKVKQTSDP